MISYEKEFGLKFSVCFKTMYKYIKLGYFGLQKENLYFHGNKRKSKNNKNEDNRGKLVDFKDYKQFLNDLDNNVFDYSTTWEMDTIYFNNFYVLGLVNKKSKFGVYGFLKNKRASTVLSILKKIIKKIGANNFDCILTDRGKEFYKWKDMERYFNLKVYFCDPGKPKQKASIERMNRDCRRCFFANNNSTINVEKRLDVFLDNMNNMIRPCLGNMSAIQAFNKISIF